MPGKVEKAKSPLEATRKAARVVFSTIKKIGHSKGVTLKKIHDYIKDQYPNSPSNIVKLNNTLEKALAFGALKRKIGNRYALGSIIKSLDKPGRKISIVTSRRRRRSRKGKGRRRRRRHGHKRSHTTRRYKARS